VSFNKLSDNLLVSIAAFTAPTELLQFRMINKQTCSAAAKPQVLARLLSTYDEIFSPVEKITKLLENQLYFSRATVTYSSSTSMTNQQKQVLVEAGYILKHEDETRFHSIIYGRTVKIKTGEIFQSLSPFIFPTCIPINLTYNTRHIHLSLSDNQHLLIKLPSVHAPATPLARFNPPVASEPTLARIERSFYIGHLEKKEESKKDNSTDSKDNGKSV